MNVLYITHNRIGDAVLSSGLLAHVVARFDNAKVTVVCGPAVAPLFAATPRVARVIALRKQPYHRHWMALWRDCIGTRWDLIIDLRGTVVTWLLRADERRTLSKAPESVHRVVHAASALGLDPAPTPTLWADAAAVAEAEDLMPADRPILALGPTANWGGKQWPAERFVALAERLTAPGAILGDARIAVFGAAAERAAAAALLRAVPEGRLIDLVGRVDLLTVYACLRRAALYIGNDSGLMHMAAAAGAPTLGLFGPSREELYGPWGRHTAAVRTDMSFQDIITNPRYDYRRHESWMETLSVDKAERAAVELWRRVHDGNAA